MSNNIIENFEKALEPAGYGYEQIEKEAFQAMADAYDDSFNDEDYYELCSELVQNFVAGIYGIGSDYPELNQVSSFIVNKFFSKD
jgi:hypothetical protein